MMFDPPWGVLGIFISVFCKTAAALLQHLDDVDRRGLLASLQLMSSITVMCFKSADPDEGRLPSALATQSE
jgi:hypothetical protein